MSAPLVLSLCDRTGNMVRPWAEAGYECWVVDLQHEPGEHRGEDGIVRVGADVVTWLPPRQDYRIAFAFPPCTNLAVSGARWFKDKGLAALAGSLAVVDRCRRVLEWTGAPWMLENPVSTLATYWREPDHTFDPSDFTDLEPADNYTKTTCLWTGNGFLVPPPLAFRGRETPPPDPTYIWWASPGPDRADFRSETPIGFARAVYLANEHPEQTQRAGLPLFAEARP